MNLLVENGKQGNFPQLYPEGNFKKEENKRNEKINLPLPAIYRRLRVKMTTTPTFDVWLEWSDHLNLMISLAANKSPSSCNRRRVHTGELYRHCCREQTADWATLSSCSRRCRHQLLCLLRRFIIYNGKRSTVSNKQRSRSHLEARTTHSDEVRRGESSSRGDFKTNFSTVLTSIASSFNRLRVCSASVLLDSLYIRTELI